MRRPIDEWWDGVGDWLYDRRGTASAIISGLISVAVLFGAIPVVVGAKLEEINGRLWAIQMASDGTATVVSRLSGKGIEADVDTHQKLIAAHEQIAELQYQLSARAPSCGVIKQERDQALNNLGITAAILAEREAELEKLNAQYADSIPVSRDAARRGDIAELCAAQ